MKQRLIAGIRSRLDFMEEFETLVSEARKKGDEEWEDNLHAALSCAESSLRDLVGLLLGDKREQDGEKDGELPF